MKENDILRYCEGHTTPVPDVLASLERETHLTQVYPRMLAGPYQGMLLRMISAMIRPKRILEIGTFTGYSAICLAEGTLPLTPPQKSTSPPTPLQEDTPPLTPPQEGRGILHTIEVNPEQEEIIRKYIKMAGMEERIVLHTGDAMEIIKELDESWDLVFIDADKPNYLNYYMLLIDKLAPGSFILADNALWDGKVLDPDTTDKEAQGIMAFNEYVNNDPRVENILLPVRDGIMILRKL
jgi:caffeoyl-CoA O-methyltransferase